MGMLTRLRGQDGGGIYPRVPIAEAMAHFDVVELEDGVLLLADRPGRAPVKEPPLKLSQMAEIGTTRSTWSGILREDYNTALRGIDGLQQYDKMRRSDVATRSSLRVVKTPLLAARWFIEPFSDAPEDILAAQFLEWNLFHGMSTSFPQLLNELLAMLDFGFYNFEKVFEFTDFQGQNLIKWKKLAPRHPLDLVEWVFDDNGGPESAWFYDSPGSPDGKNIPIEKLLIFTHEKEGGNIEGLSVLRSAYKHWFYAETLYKIDAIQKERHGIGIPIIKLPPNFNTNDRNAAHEIGRNLRTNEKAHVVLPPMWDIAFADLRGMPVDALESAKHHSQMIMQNVLAGFLTQEGTGANTEDAKEIFLKSTRYIAEVVKDVFNKYAIPQLMDMNWELLGYPELRVRRIGDIQDWRIITFAIRNLVGANVLMPDERLEDWFRDEMDLPRTDTTTRREVQAKQGPTAKAQPAKAGMPRQAPATKQKIQPGSSAGKDGSGTSGVGR